MIWLLIIPKALHNTYRANSRDRPGYGSVPYCSTSTKKMPNDQTSDSGRSRCSRMTSGANHLHASCASTGDNHVKRKIFRIQHLISWKTHSSATDIKLDLALYCFTKFSISSKYHIPQCICHSVYTSVFIVPSFSMSIFYVYIGLLFIIFCVLFYFYWRCICHDRGLLLKQL